MLGRAKDASDYIKYGADKASITIELKGAQGSRNVVVRRDIKKDKTSEWRLNGMSYNWGDSFFMYLFIKCLGKVVAKNEVEAKIRSMNVQVDNLCQFLPQVTFIMHH